MRFNGIYNWYGEVHNLWTHANNISKAHQNFISKLSSILGFSNGKIRCYFNNGKDNYSIKDYSD